MEIKLEHLTKEYLEQIAIASPEITLGLKHYQSGSLSWEEALIFMVVHLAYNKAGLIKTALEMQSKMPPPIIPAIAPGLEWKGECIG